MMNYLPEWAEEGDKFDATLEECAWYQGKITGAKVVGDDAFECEVLFDDGDKKTIVSTKKDNSGHEHPPHVLTPWFIVDSSGKPVKATKAKANVYQLKVHVHVLQLPPLQLLLWLLTIVAASNVINALHAHTCCLIVV